MKREWQLRLAQNLLHLLVTEGGQSLKKAEASSVDDLPIFPPRTAARLTGVNARRTLAWENQHGLIPVSYTHLRAHETSLQLVCRLLLEKK